MGVNADTWNFNDLDSVGLLELQRPDRLKVFHRKEQI
jgi:hypothetical protein